MSSEGTDQPQSSTADPASPLSIDETDYLPSPTTSGSSSTTSPLDDDDIIENGGNDEMLSDAERQWRESMQQLELLLTMVLIPYLGKVLGRRCAFWG